MKEEAHFIVVVKEVEIEGAYVYGINEGYIIAIGFNEKVPEVTIGNNIPVCIYWDFEREIGACFLDSYMTANIRLYSSIPIKVCLFVMLPIAYAPV